MPSLIALLCAYPVLENLVAVLPIGDLFNLSKANSTCRAVLHGFPISSISNPSSPKVVRPALSIGRHNTSHWRNLKIKSLLCCSEPQHTRGAKIKGCLLCSMPVCEACIIKASFGKHDENTFANRTRSLCVECFDSGNSHQESSLNGEEKIVLTSSLIRTECICTARDGHLCLRCKTKQNSNVEIRTNQCYGIGCSKSKSDSFGGRVCLWCDLPLPRERSRAESRRDYDARHLLARTHSSYKQTAGEVAEDESIDSAEPETVRTSSPLTPPASERTSSPKKGKAVLYDPFEDERRRELERVSERRLFTAWGLEEERWRRSEILRRSNSMCRAPPPPKMQGTILSLSAENSPLCPSDSIASVQPSEDDLSPPSYDSCIRNFSNPSPPRP